MRIIYLHQYFNTPKMPGGTRSYEMGRRLVAAGHEVEMITTWREPCEQTDWFTTEEAGIRVHWLPLPYSNRMKYRERMKAFLRFARASARKAAALNGDVIFATSTPLTIAVPALYVSKRRRIPMVFEIRDLWPDVPIAMGVLNSRVLLFLSRALEKIAYKNAAAIVALAPGMKETICQNQNVPEDKVHVIPNGCDFDVFGNRDIVPAQLPEAKEKDSAILYIGTMGKANGVEYIPRLAAEIQRLRGSDPIKFYLIGDGRNREDAIQLAKELGVLDCSVFFIGQLPKHEVANWLTAADATIMTYAGPEIVFRDSVSNKFFDSLAAGKPVIANFAGFSSITAEAAKAGFIIDQNPEIAARQLLEIAGRKNVFEKAGAAAYALAREQFSRDQLAAKLEAVIRQAVDGRAHRRRKKLRPSQTPTEDSKPDRKQP